VNSELLTCKKCRRLDNQLKRLRVSHPDYWNRPVPACGAPDADLLIVGLAPGLHGANRTGKPFTGDASGELLFDVLETLQLTERVRITNAVKCLPVKNLPSGREVQNCARFLASDLENHKSDDGGIMLILGGVAHRAVIRSLGLRQTEYPFGHGRVHQAGNWTFVDSYHCSRYNTQTGRLTRDMFLEVVSKAAGITAS
jgi:uracil-DNA glycosylase family 4